MLQALVCPTSGACTGIGQAQDAQGDQYGLIVSNSGGPWKGVLMPVPSNDTFLTQFTQPALLTCISANHCAVAGTYTDLRGNTEAVVDTGVGQRWRSLELPLPAGALTGHRGTNLQTAFVDGLWCDSLKSCVAVGSYEESTASRLEQGFIDERPPPSSRARGSTPPVLLLREGRVW